MRYRQPLTVPIAIDRSLAQPLPDQIAAQVRTAVAAGTLPGGVRLPSTRILAELLGVSRGVTSAAYDGLHRTGHLYRRTGSGTYVSQPHVPQPHAPRPYVSQPYVSQPYVSRPYVVPSTAEVPCSPAVPVVLDLRPGIPPPEVFPLAAWRSAWRWASHRPPPPDPVPPLGLPELREALASHLRRLHGVDLDGRLVMATCGIRPARRALAGTTGLAVIVIGPASVLPTSVPASALPALARPALASSRVGRDTVLLGGFAEVLTAHLPVGYAVLPEAVLPEAVLAALRRLEPPGYLAQRVATRLLLDGVVERAILRCRSLYAQRDELARAALADLPVLAAVLVPARPGTALVRCGDQGTRADLVAALRGTGIAVGRCPAGLLVGYGHLAEPDLRHALVWLAHVLTGLLTARGW